ncbi:MAG: AMP-binding protein [Solirubrobacterales bacterium]|nr:AMP-binding protein [Solirubrobacterales bacterium]
MRIVDADGAERPSGEVGEVAIRSPFTMAGYWRAPELTAETILDGWLRTGDMARADPLGYVYIVDRKKDMIISGGENVYPRELEEVLYQHPGVLEAAVIGVPHPVWGESPCALVVARPGVEVGGQELIEFCRERLAHYKCPSAVEFREELPKSASGKILKRELRQPYVHAGVGGGSSR